MRASGRLIGSAAPAAILLAVLIGAWEMAVRAELVNALILPLPSEVAVALKDLVVEGIIWEHLLATFIETTAGFAIGSGLGVVLAVAAGLSPLMRRALFPYVISLQVTPLIAVAPLIVAWLGFGYSSKIAIAALICFFPVFVNTLAGLVSVGEEEREMFRSLGASPATTFRRLLLPHALPTMFAGFKTAMTLALIGAVVGEFVSAERGLGLLVSRFSYQLAVPQAFAVVLVLTLMGLVLFATMVFLERLVVFWRHDARLTARTKRFQSRDQPAPSSTTLAAAGRTSRSTEQQESEPR